jgi:hypothetical protein
MDLQPLLNYRSRRLDATIFWCEVEKLSRRPRPGRKAHGKRTRRRSAEVMMLLSTTREEMLRSQQEERKRAEEGRRN